MDRPVLFVFGAGFDPRCTAALSDLLDCADESDVHILELGLPIGRRRGENTSILSERNAAEASPLLKQAASVRKVPYPEDAPGGDAGLAMTRSALNQADMTADTAVVLDVSSLPSSVYFPLIAGLLQRAEVADGPGELIVLVGESPELDSMIAGSGLGSPGPLAGFRGGITDEAAPTDVAIWAPIIGEQSDHQLSALYEFLEPDEVCPVLPFPATNPRRADDLLLEHRELLFDRVEIEPENIIYADERNPFDLYRAIVDLHERYADALEPLGRTQVVVSSHASKVLSVGVCLAAWERQLAVLTAGPTQYGISQVPEPDWVRDNTTLCAMWLDGSPYR